MKIVEIIMEGTGWVVWFLVLAGAGLFLVGHFSGGDLPLEPKDKTKRMPHEAHYLAEPVAGSPEENAKHAIMLKNLLSHADIEGWQDYIWGEPGFWRFELGQYMSHEERDALIALRDEVDKWRSDNATIKIE